MEEDVAGRRRAKQDQILAGATRVFLRDGFAATSTDLLAQEAGVSKSTLYAYYPSKEELFVDVVRRLTLENPQTQMLDFLQSLTPHHVEELHATLVTLGQKLLTTIMQLDALALLRAIIADAHRFPKLTETLRSTILEQAVREVSLMLERARDNGITIRKGDTEIMTRLFIGPLMSYAMFDGLLHPQGIPQPPGTEKIEAIVNLFLNAILEHGEFERKQR